MSKEDNLDSLENNLRYAIGYVEHLKKEILRVSGKHSQDICDKVELYKAIVCTRNTCPWYSKKTCGLVMVCPGRIMESSISQDGKDTNK